MRIVQIETRQEHQNIALRNILLLIFRQYVSQDCLPVCVFRKQDRKERGWQDLLAISCSLSPLAWLLGQAQDVGRKYLTSHIQVELS